MHKTVETSIMEGRRQNTWAWDGWASMGLGSPAWFSPVLVRAGRPLERHPWFSNFLSLVQTKVNIRTLLCKRNESAIVGFCRIQSYVKVS